MPEPLTSVKNIVITRPRADAATLAGILTRKGFNCIIEPILSIETLHRNAKQVEYALENKPQLIVITSRHAASALAMMTDIRGIPVLAVGKATAEQAINLGFTNVSFANGTAGALLAAIESNYIASQGPLLYLRGADISTDIAARLRHNDFMVDSVVVYQAHKARVLSDALCDAFNSHAIDAVLFFSQNTLKTYARLATTSGIAEAHRNVTAFCISKSVVEKAAGLLPWKSTSLFPPYIASII